MASTKANERFQSSSDGTAAIEFALVAPVFLLMMFAILEYSYFEFKSAVLRGAVFESARSIQTGDVQKHSDPAARFEELYCEAIPDFIDCDEVAFDVRSFDHITLVDFPPVALDGDSNPTNFGFDPGYQEKIVTVRATVKHNFVYDPLRDIFQPDDKPVIILGYNVFKNEPFGCIDEC